MKALKILSGIVGLIILGGGMFYAGLNFGKKQQQPNGFVDPAVKGEVVPTVDPNIPTRQNGGVVNGEVTAVSGKSLKIKLGDGASRDVLITDETIIRTFNVIPFSEITSGKYLLITGKSNKDGSLSAQSIQLLASTSSPYQAKPASGVPFTETNAR